MTQNHYRLDAHQHYWDPARTFPASGETWSLGGLSYAWQQAGLIELDRAFLPAELEPQLCDAGIDQSILVNVLNSAGETQWMLELAAAHDSIAGVVGWVDLRQAPEVIDAELSALTQDSKLVGIRHLGEFESDPRWLLRDDVIAGLEVLERRGLPFDLLLSVDQLELVPALSERLPRLPMVIDHLAKPLIRQGVYEPWRSHLHAAASNPLVHCKLSGMVTEADRQSWQTNDLVPYVEAGLEAFGSQRVMYGSDWPVCTLAATYAQVHRNLLDCLEQVAGGREPLDEAGILANNAVEFYGIRARGCPNGDLQPFP